MHVFLPQVMDGFQAALPALFFVFLILFGSFFLLNLTLAVIWEEFENSHEQEAARKQYERMKAKRSSDVAQSCPNMLTGSALSSVAEGSPVVNPGTSAVHVVRESDRDVMSPPGGGGGTESSTAAAHVPFRGTSVQQLQPSGSGRSVGSGSSRALVRRLSRGLPQSYRQGLFVPLNADGTAPLHVDTDEDAERARPRTEAVTSPVPAIDDTIGDNSAMARVRRACLRLTSNYKFSVFMMGLILANTTVLAWDHYPMDAATSTRLDVVNFMLTVLFAVEMIVKLLGLGVRAYFRDRFNMFDAVIVTAAIVELGLLPPAFFGVQSSGGSLSVLRTFRLFRIFKFARSWTSLRVLLETIGRSLKDVVNFAILLLLFMYIFALVGMQFFANRFCFDETTGLASTVQTEA